MPRDDNRFARDHAPLMVPAETSDDPSAEGDRCGKRVGPRAWTPALERRDRTTGDWTLGRIGPGSRTPMNTIPQASRNGCGARAEESTMRSETGSPW
jgi:hypothetical protein